MFQNRMYKILQVLRKMIKLMKIKKPKINLKRLAIYVKSQNVSYSAKEYVVDHFIKSVSNYSIKITIQSQIALSFKNLLCNFSNGENPNLTI